MIQQLSPAGCDGRVSGDETVFAELKVDGHRGLFHFGVGLDRGYLTGRRKSKRTKLFTEKGLCVPHLMRAGEELAQDRMGYTVLDGEVTIPDHPFEAVQSVMGSYPDRAIAWQEENRRARYTVFDLLFYDGQDVRRKPRCERRLLAMDVVEELRKFSSRIGFVYWDKLETEAEREALFERVTGEGHEGLVVKTIRGRYGSGQKKMKAVKTFDVVISGFTDAREGKTGQFLGLIGAVKFSAYRDGALVEVGQCSGMDLPQRRDFTARKDWYLGQVVEVKSNGVTRHGRLRHPQFLRLRGDKAPEECVAP